MSYMAYAKAAEIGLGFLQKQAEADRQNYNHEVNRIRAAEAQNLKIQNINSNLLSALEQQAQADLDREILALQASERRAVVAGSAGFKGGSTIDNFINQPLIKKLRADTIASENANMARRQAELAKINVTAETENRINSVPQGQQPSLVQYAMKAGGTLYAGFMEDQANLPENIAAREVRVQNAIADYTSGKPLPEPSWFGFKPE